MAPPSVQLLHTVRVPVPAFCGLVVAIVCDDPDAQVRAWADVSVLPSTLKEAPAGLVCTVTAIGDGVTTEYWKFGGT